MSPPLVAVALLAGAELSVTEFLHFVPHRVDVLTYIYVF